MIERVRTSFAAQLSAAAHCLQEHTHAEFHVHDPPAPTIKGEPRQPCRVLTTGEAAKSDLHVQNLTRRAIHFVAIDHCLYDDSHPSKCDCALVSGEAIYFVEFKTQEDRVGATTISPFANPGDCITQLAASIRDFYDRGIIKPGQTVHAYASVGYPRQRPQHGAHHLDQLNSLQRKTQEGQLRPMRLRYCSESELDIK